MNRSIPHILLVESNDDFRFIVQEWLKSFRWEVVTACDVRSGSQLALQQQFDLYVFDTSFPDGDCRVLFESIRRFDSTTPIIFFSEAPPANLCKSANSSKPQCVTKPDLVGLKEAVASALAERGAASLN